MRCVIKGLHSICVMYSMCFLGFKSLYIYKIFVDTSFVLKYLEYCHKDFIHVQNKQIVHYKLINF